MMALLERLATARRSRCGMWSSPMGASTFANAPSSSPFMPTSRTSFPSKFAKMQETSEMQAMPLGSRRLPPSRARSKEEKSMLNPTRRPVVLDTTTRFAPTVKQEEDEVAPRWVRGRWAGQVLVQLPLPSVE